LEISMKGLKNILRFISLLILAILVIIGMVYWVYPQYHLARINKVILPRLEHLAWGVNEVISPNGIWGIEISYNRNNSNEIVETIIQFSSIDIPFRKFSFFVPDDYRYIESNFGMPWVAVSWSPNSKSIFLVQYIHRFCIDQQFVLFNEVNGKWEGPYYYKTQEPDGSNCYSFSWSDDGTQLAIHTRSLENSDSDELFVTILNTKAEVQQEFSVNSPVNGYGFDYLYWNENKFILINLDPSAHNDQENTERQKQATSIYYFTIDEPENVSHVIDLTRYYIVLGWEPVSSRILMATNEGVTGCEYLVINAESKQVEQNGNYNGLCSVSRQSKDNVNIAFLINDQSSKKSYTQFWNWKTMKFIDKELLANIRILPWQDTLRGFLILRESNNGKEFFDVLRP
jgi:hypothetical protein